MRMHVHLQMQQWHPARVVHMGEIRELTVEDRLGPLTFRGEILADLRYEGNDRPRYTDMALYRIVESESPYRYGLEIVARSFVYHRINGKCVKPGRHLVTTVSQVRQNSDRWKWLFPCHRCNPPDLEHMASSARIAEESNDPHFYVCADASDIVAKLYMRSGEISSMAAKLLRVAAGRDPEIAEAMTSNRRRLPSWRSGRPEDIDIWLRDRIPDEKRHAFYKWIADTAIEMA